MMHGYGSMHIMHYGWIFQIVIILLLFLVIWWMMKGSGNFGFKCKNETALEILKKRLAKGEITQKEFHKLKKEIE